MSEEDDKYNEDSEEEQNDKDYFSMNSGIDASKFRKRLSQLQHQSEKLENLTFQLLSIKNADYITELDTIWAISIIQETKHRNKPPKSKGRNKKKHKANHKMVLNLFTDTETERAFNAINGSFEDVCYSYWKDTNEASNTSLIQSYQMVETPYSLFSKNLNNKSIILLMVGQHTKEQIASCRLLDILQTIIVDLCTSLQVNNGGKQTKKSPQSMEERKLSLIAMIEILDEVFGGNGDDVYPLDQTEFVTCMRVRIGTLAIAHF